jgi:hypothetical protein
MFSSKWPKNPTFFSQNQLKMKVKSIFVSGEAVFTSDREKKQEYVQFLPDDPETIRVEGWRHEGVAQRLGNGTFDFISRPRIRSNSVLLKKVAHGRLSATKDGAIQLTLKIFKSEGIPMRQTFLREALEALDGFNQ